MKPTLGLMLVAAMALLMVAPSGAAMQYVGPRPPPVDTTCPVTEPGDGGLEGQVKDAAHLATATTCGLAGDGIREAGETAAIGVGLALDEVELVMTAISPFVDGTQSNVCDAVYGAPPHDGDLGCNEIVVNLA